MSQFPSVSAAKAASVSQYYPTLTHLLEAYAKCDDDDERAGLLMNVFGNKKEGKLSEDIWRFMCSKKGDEVW